MRSLVSSALIFLANRAPRSLPREQSGGEERMGPSPARGLNEGRVHGMELGASI
jgi:hypothetical protein